jgi:ribosomal protein L11 methyltransferase
MAILEIPPRFRVADAPAEADARTIVLAPSRAFGDGTHETTRMCVQALAAFAPRRAFTMLDVGSGTGILAIAAAKLGGTPLGVEIDEAANEAARRNARLNGFGIGFRATWPEGTFDVVVANILRDVLLELAPAITSRAGGLLVLSGLVSTDVPAILARYSPLRGDRRPEIFERDAWRALVWR